MEVVLIQPVFFRGGRHGVLVDGKRLLFALGVLALLGFKFVLAFYVTTVLSVSFVQRKTGTNKDEPDKKKRPKRHHLSLGPQVIFFFLVSFFILQTVVFR